MALDGARGWHLKTQLGEPIYGPLALLTQLELQLGLVAANTSFAGRVVQMRECLQAAKSGSRFYEASFNLDELGTAATLLEWRDAWYEQGWTGNCAADAPPRIADLGFVEGSAKLKVALGIGQRLTAIETLLSHRRPQIASIKLEEPLAAWPKRWQDVLSRLPIVEPQALVPCAKKGSGLHGLQVALLAAQNGLSMPLVDNWADGSILVLRAESALASSQWVANKLVNDPAAADRIAIVAEQHGTLLDAALEGAGGARLGLGQASTFRPAFQLVPLALRVLTDPVDFGILLQFLTHPICPIPGSSRRQLAQRLAGTPGIGGESWEQLLLELANAEEPGYEARLAELRYWLEHPRYPREAGLPLSVLVERTSRIAQFFDSGASNPDLSRRAAMMTGRELALSLEVTLQALLTQGSETISAPALDKLVVQSMGSGLSNPHQFAQAGAAATVSTPAALIEPFTEVVWWHLTVPGGIPKRPWSKGELLALRKAGALLPDNTLLTESQALAWLRPIMLAQEKLTLVLPPEGEELHPVWWLVKNALPGLPVETVENALSQGVNAKGLTRVVHKALPALRRWWSMPEDVNIEWDKAYSYSSLEPLVFNPYQWVLQYPAQLRGSSLLSLPDEFTLMGTLAHRLVELLYKTDGCLAWTPSQLETWIDKAFSPLISEEGAVLLMPGRQAELLSFQTRLRESVLRLHSLVQEAGVTSVKPEVALEGSARHRELKGSADLILVLADGKDFVLDMKWAGNKKYRSKLEDHSHLQLALYAKLQMKTGAAWPQVGYYILKDAELLTPALDVFKGIKAVAMEPNANAALWAQLLQSWHWRAEQLGKGQVEVILDGIEPTDESATPPKGLTSQTLDSSYNPFVNLAGWDSSK
ncbi:PD-(D/E)XK nuclease family protein [Paucibacter sp. B2R-40]|uniref:PD-(D/E)XK nuclease family protein n=1 Tax=Paucibacter sp. B2R-40 TaxID=2893554 RepID=UPI0021E3EE0A|nr:PD-(D/E)XK nuclease family protein [Paucibacter sp. B2R-40]MCV2356551.1 PD-(D/E)XK nuclease family protein [Paucibacter sp. B2R-40]